MHGDKFNRKEVRSTEEQLAKARAGKLWPSDPEVLPAPTSAASRPDLAHYFEQGAMSARKASGPDHVAGGAGLGNTNTTPNGTSVTNRSAQGYPKPNRHGAAPVPRQVLPTWDDVMAAQEKAHMQAIPRRTR